MGMTLKAARVNKSLTQEQAAKLLGTTKDIVCNWENARTFPDVIQIKKVMDLYEISFDEIIFLPQDNALSVEVSECIQNIAN